MVACAAVSLAFPEQADQMANLLGWPLCREVCVCACVCVCVCACACVRACVRACLCV